MSNNSRLILAFGVAMAIESTLSDVGTTGFSNSNHFRVISRPQHCHCNTKIALANELDPCINCFVVLLQTVVHNSSNHCRQPRLGKDFEWRVLRAPLFFPSLLSAVRYMSSESLLRGSFKVNQRGINARRSTMDVCSAISRFMQTQDNRTSL